MLNCAPRVSAGSVMVPTASIVTELVPTRIRALSANRRWCCSVRISRACSGAWMRYSAKYPFGPIPSSR
jgi:hypothetical protein